MQNSDVAYMTSSGKIEVKVLALSNLGCYFYVDRCDGPVVERLPYNW